jgi:pristinamycin I synthase-3/4
MPDELRIGEEAFDTETNQPVWWDGEGWSYGRPDAIPLVARPRPERLPLSFAQQRLWFLDQLGGTSAEYNMPEAMRLRGRLDLAALQRAVNALVARHETLHTRFAIADNEPVQVIDPELRISVTVETVDDVDAALRREWLEPFDLRLGPLLRVRVLQIAEEEHILLWTTHHIVFDGWSIGIIGRELVALYDAFVSGRENPLPLLPLQYADFTLWQRECAAAGRLEKGLAYWREQLRGIPERVELPAGRPRPELQTFRAAAVHATVPAERLQPLLRLARDGQATLYMTLLSALAVLLERATGQDDVVVGSPIANRRDTQLENLIGFFVNALVMRVHVRPEATFRELLAAVRKTTLDAYEYQDVPFERLVEELSPERKRDTTPLYQIAFALQNAPESGAPLRGLEIERVPSDELRVRVDLEVHAVESGGALEIVWVYNCDLFDRWRIEHLARHFTALLNDAAARPDVPLHRLRMMDAHERHTVLVDFNATERETAPATFAELFEAQVARTPEAPALISGQESLTYAELDARANSVAKALIEDGIGRERLVGISMDRSFDMYVAVLATLKAGAAYLPLDPAYPPARLAQMLEDAKPDVVLRKPLPSPRENGRVAVPGDVRDAAYVIYTSGSTGIPKGVVVTHAGFAALRDSLVERLEVGPGARVLQFASLNFDASFFDLIKALTTGAALVLPRDDERTGGPLAALIESQRITHATLPPAVLPTVEKDDLPLGTLVVAGEACPPELADRWSRGRRFLNAYGPTETTVCATMSAPLAGMQVPPIGTPLRNTKVYVLDAALEPAPIGVNGELYVAGTSLARGYLNHPALTAERFVANPFVHGERMYRTGDIARWRAGGALEFAGRADQQVKLRGVRIELGEIEAQLRRHDGVGDALALVHGDQLLGYVVARDDAPGTAQAAHISNWQQLYDATHADGAASDFNISGWNSSYDGAPIPAAEMRIWVEETVARIRALQPERVLEIGCGTGLLLTRLAPRCRSYLGLDFSASALAQLERYRRSRRDLDHVVLCNAGAHEVAFVESGSIDLVIINSVVQYFPSVDYLLDVLAEAVRVTRRGGHVFVGDVRNLPLLDAFHTSIELSKAPDAMLLGELQQRIAQARRTEKELVLDPALFEEIGRRWESVGRVECALKAGAYENELSRFRYDVTMRIGEKEALAAPAEWIDWDEEGRWRRHLVDTQESLGVRGIRDGRAAAAVEAARALSDASLSDAGALRRAALRASGEDSDAVMRLAPCVWQRFTSQGVYDAVFRPRWRPQGAVPDARRAYYRRYANEPLRGTADAELSRTLHDALRETLPDAMVPAAIVVVPAWPLTPSGKIDRRALPLPRREERAAAFSPPHGEAATLLATLWSDVLGIEHIGEDDDFFELGGHSLMAAQLMSRVRDVFGVDASVRALFDAPKLGGLARAIEATQRASGERKAPLVASPRPERIPLSFAQRRLWFIDKLHGTSSEYNMPGAWRLRGALDVEALQRTINTVIERHENLRVHFVEHDGEPFQEIAPVLRLALVAEPARIDDIASALRREADEPFDLARGPLVRARLLRLGDDDHVLLWSCHHIVADAWSMGVLNREIAALYRGESLPPLPIQYADFAIWQNSAASGDLAYWKEQLAGIPDSLELPADRSRPAVQTFAAGVCDVALEPRLLDALTRLSHRNHATLFMTLLAAFAVLLERYSGQEDVVIGTPVANRSDRQLEELIGFFVNSLALRIRVDAASTFRDLLQQVRRTTLDAYQHQDVPFERLVEELSVERSRSVTPIVQVVFALQNTPGGRQTLAGLQIEPIAGDETAVRFDLEVHAEEAGGGLQLSWVYNRDRFDRWRIEQMARHYIALLEAVAARPDAPLRALDIFTPDERRHVLRDLAGAALPPPSETVAELFEAQAERRPDAPALVFEGETVTYAELDVRANEHAARLRAQGAGMETLVELDAVRSVDTIVELLGIVKAGAAYVPRVRSWAVESARATAKARRPHPAQALYANYTSGSTGEAKGVLVPHAAVVSLVCDSDYVRLDESSRLLHFAPLSFDAATFEIWGALLNGGTVVIAPPGAVSIEQLRNVIVRERVDTLWLTAGLFHEFVDEALDAFAGVRQLLAGGDVLSPGHVARFRAVHPHCRLINGYGPTENTTFSCCHVIEAVGGSVPIGKPVRGRRAYVLDQALEPVPIGVPGELYVAGSGLARGYLDRPALTAERFVADPHAAAPGARMYRTGDRVRWRRDGALEFLGRVDGQVKIRGFRVEPGQVEAVLGAQPGVMHAAVIARDDGAGRQLVAYVVAGNVDEAALRRALFESLPEFMIPSAIIFIDALPLTANGKLDRRALPAPERRTDAAREPRTREEEILCEVFAEVLRLDRVGIDDEFFALGGHSLLAIKVISRIRTKLGVELPIAAIFDAPTPAALASRLRSGGIVRAPLAKQPRGERLPLSYAQQRLWFLYRIEGANPSYNIPLSLRLEGGLDDAALEQALRDVALRHATLRTIFPEADGVPYQNVLDAAEVRLHRERISEERLHALLSAAAATAIELREEIPLRASLFTLSAREHVLFLVIHHIAADGWSLAPLARDLAAAYAARLHGEAPAFQALPVDYADYALWQRRLLGDARDAASPMTRQLDFWRRALAGAPEELVLPADHRRPAVPGYRGGVVPIAIGAELHRSLADLARASGATVFMALQAAFAALLSRHGGGTDIPIGTPVAGRAERATEDLVGFFVNTLVLRTDLAGRPSFRELVRRVRAFALDAYTHQDLPFEQLVEALEPERSLARHPLFQVMILADNSGDGALSLPGLTVRDEAYASDLARYDLTLGIRERGTSVDLALEYSFDLFQTATAERLAASFVALLEAAVAEPDTPLHRLLRTPLPLPRAYPQPPDVIDLFERQVATTPGATALVFNDETCTYAELDARANELAARLTGPGTLIGIAHDRSIEMVVAMLAILKAGAAYVPLDPDFPPARFAELVVDAKPAFVQPGSLPARAIRAGRDPRHPAYVLYTSGSTGKPKGVVIERRALSVFIEAIAKHIRFTRHLAVTTIGFDISILELIAPLCSGAEVWLADRDTARDPVKLAALIRRGRIDSMQATPSHWSLLAGEHANALEGLRILAGGEALPRHLARLLHQRGAEVWNLYGPTEATVWSAIHRVADADLVGSAPEVVSIGRPLDGYGMHVLDDDLEAVPDGVTGELYIGGEALARGYHGRAALTAERFVADANGARMYRSGDLVRRRADGALEFRGRADAQLKVRGFRIEPAEVEAVLKAQEGVTNAVVVAREHALLGYVTGHGLDPFALRSACAQRLPEYMVPALIVPLEAMPVTPNGKIDRRALPAPSSAAAAITREPNTPSEQMLVDLFADVLGIAHAGVDDNFFAIGGHSLLATRLVSRIRDVFGLELPLKMIFERPTAAAIAEILEEAEELKRQLDALPAEEIEALLRQEETR